MKIHILIIININVTAIAPTWYLWAILLYWKQTSLYIMCLLVNQYMALLYIYEYGYGYEFPKSFLMQFNFHIVAWSGLLRRKNSGINWVKKVNLYWNTLWLQHRFAYVCREKWFITANYDILFQDYEVQKYLHGQIPHNKDQKHALGSIRVNSDKFQKLKFWFVSYFFLKKDKHV